MASTTRSDREGSLYQQHRPDCERPVDARGRVTCKCPWRGALVTGWHGDKPIRKRVTAPTRAGAAARLERLKDEVKKGQLPHGRIPTVEEWLTYWLEQIVAPNRRPNTLRTYRTHVEGYLIPLLGRHRLDKLTPEHISAVYATLRGRGLAETTIHHTHTILTRSLKVAGMRGKVVGNPASLVEVPKRGKVEPVVLDRAQGRAVIEAARGHRNAARWTVALSLGLRQGEALGLRWEDVDLDTGLVTVRNNLQRVKGKGLVLGPTKGGEPRRIVAPAPVLAELRAHRKAQNAERLVAGTLWRDGDYVFAHADGRPIDAKDDRTAWRALLDRAAVPAVTVHSARHTAATMLLAMGVPVEVVKEILGHSDIKITLGYQHRVPELHLDAAERMARAFWD